MVRREQAVPQFEAEMYGEIWISWALSWVGAVFSQCAQRSAGRGENKVGEGVQTYGKIKMFFNDRFVIFDKKKKLKGREVAQTEQYWAKTWGIRMSERHKLYFYENSSQLYSYFSRSIESQFRTEESSGSKSFFNQMRLWTQLEILQSSRFFKKKTLQTYSQIVYTKLKCTLHKLHS